MPDPVTLRAPALPKQSDGKPGAKGSFTTIVERTCILVDKNERLLRVSGSTVFIEGMKELDILVAILEQNGCDCKVERGGYDLLYNVDLSNRRQLLSILLPDGTKMTDIQIRDPETTKLEKEKVGNFEFYVSPDIEPVSLEHKVKLLTDDRHLPPIDLPSLSKKCGGGGCGGSITQQDLDTMELVASLNIRGVISVVDGTEDTRFVVLKEQHPEFSEFIYTPNKFHEPAHTSNEAVNDAVSSATSHFQPTGVAMVPDLFYVVEKTAWMTENLNHANTIVLQLTQTMISNECIPTTKIGFFGTSEKCVDHAMMDGMPHSDQCQPQSAKEAPKSFIEQKIIPEESMLMRLLMNPVERRIWGKVFGLSDLDGSTTTSSNGDFIRDKDGSCGFDKAPSSAPKLVFTYQEKKIEDLCDKNTKSGGDEPPKSGAMPKLRVRDPSNRGKEAAVIRHFEESKFEMAKTRNKEPILGKGSPGSLVVDHGKQNGKQKQKLKKEPMQIARERPALNSRPKKHQSILVSETKNKQRRFSEQEARPADWKTALKTENLSRKKKRSGKPTRAKADVVEQKDFRRTNTTHGQAFRSYTENARTRKTSSFEKACILSWLMERPRNRKNIAKG